MMFENLEGGLNANPSLGYFENSSIGLHNGEALEHKYKQYKNTKEDEDKNLERFQKSCEQHNIEVKPRKENYENLINQQQQQQINMPSSEYKNVNPLLEGLSVHDKSSEGNLPQPVQQSMSDRHGAVSLQQHPTNNSHDQHNSLSNKHLPLQSQQFPTDSVILHQPLNVLQQQAPLPSSQVYQMQQHLQFVQPPLNQQWNFYNPNPQTHYYFQ